MPSWKVNRVASITNQPAWTVGGLGPTVGKGPFASNAIQINANGQGPFRFRTFCPNQLGNIGGGLSNSMFSPSADGTNGCRDQPCVSPPYCHNLLLERDRYVNLGIFRIDPVVAEEIWPSTFNVNRAPGLPQTTVTRYCQIYRNIEDIATNFPCGPIQGNPFTQEALGIIPNGVPSQSVRRNMTVPAGYYEFVGYTDQEGYLALNPPTTPLLPNPPSGQISNNIITIPVGENFINVTIKTVGYVSLLNRWVFALKLPPGLGNDCKNPLLPVASYPNPEFNNSPPASNYQENPDCLAEIGTNWTFRFKNLITGYTHTLSNPAISLLDKTLTEYGSLLDGAGTGVLVFGFQPPNSQDFARFRPSWHQGSVDQPASMPTSLPYSNLPDSVRQTFAYRPAGSQPQSAQEFIDAVTLGPYTVEIGVQKS